MKTIDLDTLVTVIGGNLASTQRPRPWDTEPRNPRPFPGGTGPTFPPPPTIPLGPFYPDAPKPNIA